LATTRARGHASEDGEVTPGFASVAAAIEAGTIHASVAVTWESRRELGGGAGSRAADDTDIDVLAASVRDTAAEVTRRLRHPSRA
jgi:DNA-binding IclR family transcriptional regulator